MKKWKWLKVLWILFAIILIALIGLRVMLPGIIVDKVNEALARELAAPATLGDIDLGVASGKVAIHRLNIGQPPGYGDGQLLNAGSAALKVNLSSLKEDTIRIESIEVDDVRLHLIMNTNGVLNAQALMKPKSAAAAKAEGESDPAKPVQDILLQALNARNLVLRYTDHNFGNPPLDIVFTNIHASAEGLQLGTPKEAGAAGRVKLTAEIIQPTGQRAPLGLSAKVGPLAEGIPHLNLGLRLVGLELKTIQPALLPGVPQVLGGNAADLLVDLSLGPDVLDGSAYLKTDKGTEYPILFAGSPAKPTIDAGALTGAVLKRPSKFIQAGLANAAQSAERLAVGAVDAGKDLVQGAGNTAKKMGTGLLNAVKGLAKGDVKEVGEGLTEATVGATTVAVEAVGETAGSVTEGVVEAGTTVTGSDDQKRWRDEVPARFSAEFSAAGIKVDHMHWPPRPVPVKP